MPKRLGRWRFLAAGSKPYIVFAGLALTQVLIVIMGAPLVRYFGYIAKVPNALLAPLLAALCFVGAFVERRDDGSRKSALA